MKQTLWYNEDEDKLIVCLHLNRGLLLVFISEDRHLLNPRSRAYLTLVDGYVQIGEL